LHADFGIHLSGQRRRPTYFFHAAAIIGPQNFATDNIPKYNTPNATTRNNTGHPSFQTAIKQNLDSPIIHRFI